MVPSHAKYRPDIDGLRAVAVLSVVVFHAFPAVAPGGFIGVDIFFVISGFLISTILFTNLEDDRFSFQQFYARRIKRIFPAVMVVLLACLIVGRWFLLADEYKLLGKHVAAGTGFVSNIVLWTESGYFDKAAELKPLLHLWSLGIEEQYYLLWPPLVLLAWTRKRVLLLLVALFSVSFAINIAQVKDHAIAAYYLPFGRMWELLAGCCLAYVPFWKKDGANGWSIVPGVRGNLASALGSAFILTAVFALDKHTKFPGWAALLPIAGTVLMISAGANAWINRHILSRPPVVFVGLISYPLYLWHWPLLSFARIILSEQPGTMLAVIMVAASILLAWITYRFVERPIRVTRTFRVPVSLFATALILGLAGAGINQTNGMLGRYRAAAKAPEPVQAAKAPTEVPSKEAPSKDPATSESAGLETAAAKPDAGPGASDPVQPVASSTPATGPKADAAPRPESTTEEIYAHQQEQFLDHEYEYGANSPCEKFSIVNDGHDNKCQMFDVRRDATVALLGDSHASSMYLGLATYYSSFGDNLVNLGRGGCLPFWGVNTELKEPDGTTSECEKFMDRLLNYVAASTSIDTVILANRGGLYLDGGPRPAISSADPTEKSSTVIYEREYGNTITRLLAARKKVIVAMDFPEMGFDPHACLARPGIGAPVRSKCAVPQSEADAKLAEYRKVMYRILARLPDVPYIDVSSAFCDGVDCWGMKGSALFYRDGDHLSHDGALHFVPEIKLRRYSGRP